MDKAKQAKDLYKFQKQAKEIKQKLKNIHIEAEENGFTITIDAEQIPISVKITDQAMQDRNKLEESILKALTKGLKKSQEVAAANMKDIFGAMGMPGM
ncbi:MAG: hypothetical protein UT55_C0001G0017 [Candidatus Peregrinibacteria bacterium GW2011_GWE2_39_6]|nr:MAG: hypothetical protein UT36_C0005G0041 [Candidatus Peregrinibacteria bacterium GW2011_GWF2_39_17]KKR26806.1 MAG: hypothetical protein UT55_C0001G0017 [Candidatus Peregrinibacteria bacterium GW2011_GWE2_39_6]